MIQAPFGIWYVTWACRTGLWTCMTISVTYSDAAMYWGPDSWSIPRAHASDRRVVDTVRATIAANILWSHSPEIAILFNNILELKYASK